MEFTIIFELSPAGIFGVPEEGVTVVPAGPREIQSDVYTNTGAKVGHGMLPIYRSADQALAESFTINGSQVGIEDNFLTIQVEAASPLEAFQAATSRVESLLAHLAVEVRRVCSFRPVYFVDAEGTPRPVPMWTTFGTVTTYNLDQLGQNVRNASLFASLADPQLDRALHYFEHALLLYEGRGQLVRPSSSHFRSLIAAVFLNLWKAVSIIVGEPGRDGDYQRRYRQFGISNEYFKTEIEWLRSLRNDYDVAHYHLSDATIKQTEAMFARGVKVASEVIQHYRRDLVKTAEQNDS
jgi:hypothetical protein